MANMPWSLPILYTGRRILLSYSRDDRRIKTTTEKDTVRYIAHQLAFDRSFESIMDFLYRSFLLRFSILQLFFSLLGIIYLIFFCMAAYSNQSRV